MTITRESLACLTKWGFRYSSSTYSEYGIEKIEGIDEIPVSAVSFLNDDKNRHALPKNLTPRMLFKKIPFGSGLFVAILGTKTSWFINHLNAKDMPAVLFVHPIQMYRRGDIEGYLFKLRVLARNPLCIPYTINILKPMERLLERHRFASFKKYYYG